MVIAVRAHCNPLDIYISKGLQCALTAITIVALYIYIYTGIHPYETGLSNKHGHTITWITLLHIYKCSLSRFHSDSAQHRRGMEHVIHICIYISKG